MTIEMWAEKYEPKTLDEYVFQSKDLEQQVRNWVETRDIPHLLLCGEPGTGKTCLLLLLMKVLGVDNSDIKFKNSSDDNSINVVRDDIKPFAETMSMDGEPRYVIMDEADGLSKDAQKALRGVIGATQRHCRFLLTANYPEHIIQALRDSRLHRIDFNRMDRTAFLTRVAQILIDEKIEVEEEPLVWLVDKCYPDMRKAITTARECSRSGVLKQTMLEVDTKADEWKYAVLDYLKTGRGLNALRKIICETVPANDFVGVYQHIYRNLEGFAEEDKYPGIIVDIRDGMYKHSSVADAEINLMATLASIRLTMEE